MVDGKVSEQEIPLLQPSVCVTKASSGIAFSDGKFLIGRQNLKGEFVIHAKRYFALGCVTRIREANIRRNNKDTNSELGTPDCDNENEIILLEPGYGKVKLYLLSNYLFA